MRQLDSEIIVTSAFGLETVVRHELSALGYESSMLQPGRQIVATTTDAICRMNLFLRCAERVLICVGRFPAEDFDQLFEGTRELPWERWIPRDGAFPVNAKSIKSQLSSVPAIQRSVKKAVALRLQQSHHTDALEEGGATFTIEAALLNNAVTLTLDTCGAGLHKRGYRPMAGAAPLRETLAAAMIQLARWEPELPFIDPFCGSGTLPIEAAMLGRGIAPGSRRSFVAESWPAIPAESWIQARQEAADLEQPSLSQRLLGTDINGKVLAKARLAAVAAGVADDLHFQARGFDELTSQREFGCLICNPPYGHRLSGTSDESRRLQALYRSMPLVLRRLPTWSHYILTSIPDFETIIGQRASKRRKLYNGRIECQFYQFFGPRPNKRTSAIDQQTAGEATERQSEPRIHVSAPTQAFGGFNEAAQRQADEFGNRLRRRAKHLRRWPRRGVHCYRLYERDVPDVPLVVDRYEDWLHIAEFDRPHERTKAEHADWLDLMKQTAARAVEIDPSQAVIKHRRRQRGESQYQRISETNQELVVRERDLQFLVNLTDFVDTGLFLDHRETRRMVGELAAGKDFLNLFAYTGTFSVYAAAGGAASTQTVDLSARHLQWAQRNFELNGFPVNRAHQFVESDALSFISRLPASHQFDLVVVDPPTFSNSKRLDRDWDVQRDYVELLIHLARHVRKGGIVLFSTNFRRFKLNQHALPFGSVHEISRQTVPEDFPQPANSPLLATAAVIAVATTIRALPRRKTRDLDVRCRCGHQYGQLA